MVFSLSNQVLVEYETYKNIIFTHIRNTRSNHTHSKHTQMSVFAVVARLAILYFVLYFIIIKLIELLKRRQEESDNARAVESGEAPTSGHIYLQHIRQLCFDDISDIVREPRQEESNNARAVESGESPTSGLIYLQQQRQQTVHSIAQSTVLPTIVPINPDDIPPPAYTEKNEMAAKVLHASPPYVAPI